MESIQMNFDLNNFFLAAPLLSFNSLSNFPLYFSKTLHLESCIKCILFWVNATQKEEHMKFSGKVVLNK